MATPGRTCLALISFLALFLFPSAPAFAESLLTCTLNASASFEGQDDRIAVEQNKYNMKILVTGADGPNPAVTGDFGDGEVFVIRKRPGVIWFAEYPASGGVFILTLYVDKKIALYSKQYERDSPYGHMAMGKCK